MLEWECACPDFLFERGALSGKDGPMFVGPYSFQACFNAKR